MQSNKWTFSLASLVMLIAIGLVMAPLSVMAHPEKKTIAGQKDVEKDPKHPTLTLSVPDALPRGETENTAANSVIDASSATDIQMIRPASNGTLKIQLKSDVLVDVGAFAASDFTLTGFDSSGFPIGTLVADAGITVAHADTTNPDGKNFEVSIDGGGAGIDSSTSSDLATLYIVVDAGAVTNIDPAIHPSFTAHPVSNISASLKIMLVDDNADDGDGNDATGPSDPRVISVTRVPDVSTPVSGPFTLEVVLSEMPEGDVGPGFFTPTNGTITKVDAGAPYDQDSDLTDGDDAATDENEMATGFDDKYYPYYLAVTPKLDIDDPAMVTIKVNDFMDTNQPMANEYSAGLDPDYEILIAAAATTGPAAGFSHPEGVTNQKALPAVTIPAGGYLVLLNHDAEVGHDKHAGVQTPAATDDYVVTQKYSWQGANLHAADLESFFRNGGTVQVIGPTGTTAESVIISEIMWGSLNGDIKNQWIELQNTGTADLVIAANTWFLGVYGPAGRSAADLAADTASAVVDELSNSPGGVFWSVAGKGQSGRTSTAPGDPNEDAISMYRVIIAGVAGDGTMAGSWMQSALPSANLRGLRVGTPGAASPEGMAPVVTDPVVEDPVVVEEPMTPVAMPTDIGITEIMVDTGNGRLPQWIELTNLSSAAVSLAGWSAVIDNAADADVLGGGAPISIDLGDVELGVGEGMAGDRTGVGEGHSLLLVAWSTRNSGNFNADRVMSLATQLEQTGRYQLLSYNGFSISLMLPQTSAVTTYGDVVGNLGMAWELSMAEAGRSSLIRREMGVNGVIMGTDAAGWVLASGTDLILGPTSWYGSDEDAGTPGYDSGGALPVELSMFYPAVIKSPVKL